MTNTRGLKHHTAKQQLELLDASIHDARPSVATGFDSLDSLLRRGGLLPGTMCLLGGRTGTRKSTVMVNMMVRMAQAGVPVGYLGLDQASWQYVVSLLSVFSGQDPEWVERHWDDDHGRELRKAWREGPGKLVNLLTGARPSLDHLSAQVDMLSMSGDVPAVVFIDYVGLMGRGRYEKVTDLVENMKVWSTDSGISVVALHQLNRNDEYGGTNNRNAGHMPVTLAQLREGGEEPVDMVLGVYRPAMDPIGNMAMDMAQMVLGDRFDEEEFFQSRSRVKKYKDSTFLQLLKNRPGTHREERGIELVSPNGESLYLEEHLAPEASYDEEEEDARRA